MYLTAHRVRSIKSEVEGINAFYRVHEENWPESTDWEQVKSSTDWEQVKSRLVHKNCPVQPGINRIRSYLDIIAPDGASPRDIIFDFEHVLTSTISEFPTEISGQSSLIRFGVEEALAGNWRAEAQRLFYECLHVWRGSP